MCSGVEMWCSVPFRGEAQYIAPRKVHGYFVTVYQTLGDTRGTDAFCVAPQARGGWLNGCLVQAPTLDDALDKLGRMLPGFIHWLRADKDAPYYMNPKRAKEPRL